MEQQREWTVGASVLRFEPPDVLRAQFRGVVSLEEAKRLTEVYREAGVSRPFYMVADLSELTAIPEEIRRYFSENSDPALILSVIYVRARLAHRAVAKGFGIAAWLLGRAEKSELSKIHFASTHAQAQELLAQLRTQHGDKGT